MPVPVVMLTVEEYQVIMDRLKALEDAKATRMTDLAPLLQRLQGVESTLSAIVSTVAAMPKLDARLTVLEDKKADMQPEGFEAMKGAKG